MTPSSDYRPTRHRPAGIRNRIAARKLGRRMRWGWWVLGTAFILVVGLGAYTII